MIETRKKKIINRFNDITRNFPTNIGSEKK